MSDELRPDVPHAARMWNHWMGGKDNFAADRAAADAVTAVYPDIVTMAVQSRRFLVRVVHHLAADVGIDQFLDVGSGLPTMQNTHEVAQAALSRSRVVYVDNDPMVLAYARALLTTTTADGATAYVDADYHEPERILAESSAVIDFARPVAVLFMGVLGYVAELAEMQRIVRHVVDALAPGSHLVLWDGTDTGDAVVEGGEKLADAGAVPYVLRSPDELASCFAGLEWVEPGLVPITGWRPGRTEVGGAPHIDAYGGVART